MLAKVKSLYFSINIFTYIDERRKLNLIKYNKALQKILHINIFNYKLLSEKYIINQSKDIYKIYNVVDDFLLFEGNYINGIGKEYYEDGKLFFEGEYLNGKKSNSSNSNCMFDGINNILFNCSLYQKQGI